jgi:catechol 2,3-dioxygenase-like lactoylglutathione lyase family enzyme
MTSSHFDSDRSTRQSPLPQWRGFHHLALVTPDLDATIVFYRDVLGMEIGEIRSSGVMNGGRHCFIKPGSGTSWGLHFFEHPGAELHRYPDGLGRFDFIPGALQHIAFALPDESEARSLRERLARFGVPATPTGSIGPIRNMLFFDNNGMLLEATWPGSPEP